MFDDRPAVLRAPSSPPLRQRLYRALAHCLSTAPERSMVAFESTTGSAAPWIFARPGALVEVACADPAFEAAVVVRSEMPSPASPPPGSAGRFAMLLGRAPSSRASVEEPPLEEPLVDGLVGRGGWLGIQTFWAPRATGTIAVARRIWYATANRADLDRRFQGVALAAAGAWGRAVRGPTSFVRSGLGARRDWIRLAAGSFPREAWVAVGLHRIGRTAETPGTAPEPLSIGAEGHTVVLGASGAGKTWFLANRAARAIGRGLPVVAIDLHGDLTPSILARIDDRDRSRIVAVDVSDRPVPGIAAIGPSLSPERAAAHLVAAVKRLSPDGAEVYWGYRLERIFDGFVRLAQESGGTLLDVHSLLTDADRRDAARLATRSPDLARFLEELASVVRRNPEFLWGAAARLSKIVASPALSELLAPDDGGVPVEELLSEGRAVLVRAPFGLLGPETASFAGTLALARIYLGLAARRTGTSSTSPVTVVLDEVQGFSPRLVAEMISEGRKFGLRLVVATQFPERLAPELRSAVAGAVREFVAFRVPPPSVTVVGRWLGLLPREAERSLSDLLPGHGIVRDPEQPEARAVFPEGAPVRPAKPAWAEAVRATRTEFPTPSHPGARSLPGDEPTERILLAILAADEEGRPLSRDGIVSSAARCPGPTVDGATLADRIPGLERSGYLSEGEDGYHLTAAGERWLGLGTPTGASRESAAHRGLILTAFRIFARRGHRLEIVRQGRYDTRLPDALFRQIPERLRVGPPAELAALLDRARGTWAWRYFGGRDVHVEAEVSGALRPERIRRDLGKAAGRNAFVLFLVIDGKRASRIRSTLGSLGVGRDRAAVWTLRPFGSHATGGTSAPSVGGAANGGPTGPRPFEEPT